MLLPVHRRTTPEGNHTKKVLVRTIAVAKATPAALARADFKKGPAHKNGNYL